MIEMRVEASRERVEPFVHAIEPRIHPIEASVDPSSKPVDPSPESVDPSAQIEEGAERRGSEQADRGPDGGIHLGRERNIAE